MIAKIISLSFRLFGNMTSGTVLLAMSVVAMSAMTTDWIGVAFPVGIPVIIYLQEILIGSIQAIVFSLLVAIFLRIAKYS
jgi:F-type H+-transporting ATPase subunit a